MAIHFDDDEEENEPSSQPSRPRLVLDDGDDDDEDDDDMEDDEYADPSPKTQSKARRQSMAEAAKKPKDRRRRRRSSARFLKLGGAGGGATAGGSGHNGSIDDDDDEDAMAAEEANEHDLGAMYQNAIRMNAENRINASNSWNLSLIDHLDRFLSIPGAGSANDKAESSRRGASSNNHFETDGSLGGEGGGGSGVNFTRASCTLDASVKIYSYRVDDVHLTSYKVLANLNRTETSKKGDGDVSQGASSGSGNHNDDDEDAPTNKRKNNHPTAADTLEQNVANINLHKLDAAFDIDPLFHKMSKTFDEGGAKGLLLANLSVATNGCNIVFDSSLDDQNDKSAKNEEEKEAEEGNVAETESMDGNFAMDKSYAMVDVSTLTSTLETLLAGQSVNSLTLVPQLASLRAEFAELESQGFVDQSAPSKRYASTQAEEIEADRSIHMEALERSRASQGDLGRTSGIMGLSDDDDFSGYGADDFGGGDDNEPMDNDGMMGSFLTGEEHRFSSVSFRESFEAAQPPSQATVLLDAIASGDITGSQTSQFEYFDKAALEAIQGTNQWAGAAHWKKMKRPRKTRFKDASENRDESQNFATPAKASTRKKPKRSAKKGTGTANGKRILVDITNPPVDLEDLLRQPPKPRGKRGAASTSSDPLQLPKSAIAKHSKSDNLLPLDAGMEVRQLSSLFLRPTSLPSIMDVTNAPISSRKPVKAVGFSDVETWGGDVGGFGDYGDDDDGGAGYCFGGDDDDVGNDSAENFVVQDLDGIRKVQKVQVGYATIAKKVDVKRLKRDLWTEIEDMLVKRPTEKPAKEANVSADEEEEQDNEHEDSDAEETSTPMPDLLSFQSTIRDMQSTQSQADVTLPFYFICLLHLCNEKNLELESEGLDDCSIRHPTARDDATMGVL